MAIGVKIGDGIMDLETFEYIDYSECYIYEKITDLEQRKERAKRKDYWKFREEAIQRYLEQRKLGDFIWAIYEADKEFHPEVTPSSLTKLIFLATYVDYKGVLKWGRDHGGRKMSKKDCEKVLRVSHCTFDTFWKEMIEKNILTEDETVGGIILNSAYFSKGSLEVKKEFGARYEKIRIFINPTRELYLKTTPPYHKTLSLIYRLIPHVNRMYNLVCSNPFETDIERVNPLSLTEIGSFFGYKPEKLSRLSKILYNIEIPTEDGNKPAIRSMKNGRKKHKLFINPLLYYGGPNFEEVQCLGGFTKEDDK